MKYKFLCGNAFRSECKYSVGKYLDARQHDFSFSIKADSRDNDCVFIKTEYLGNFFHYINFILQNNSHQDKDGQDPCRQTP